MQSTLHRLFELGRPLSPRVAAAPDVLTALPLREPENSGPDHLPVHAPARRDEAIRAYRGRVRNHHQATLPRGGHIGPAALAHIAARVKSAHNRKRGGERAGR